MHNRRSSENLVEYDSEPEKTFRRRRRETKEPQTSSSESESEEFDMGDNRSIKELSASTLDNAAPLCIQYPLAAQGKTESFELKSSLLHHIPKYHGLSMEDPNKHLKEFEIVCSSMTPINVDENILKLRAFPFSLTDRAKDWLYELPSGTVYSWESMKKVFLEKFFPTSKIILLRKKISGIQQGPGESYPAYYERFKTLIASCPQHQMKEELLIQYFYEGLLPLERHMLDAAAGGALVDKTPAAAKTLIANRALNAQQYEGIGEPSRQVNEVSTNSSLEAQMANLTSLVTQALGKPNMLGVAQVCGVCTKPGHPSDQCPQLIENGGWENVNAIGFQGQNHYRNNPYSNTYNEGWRNHPSFGWRNSEQPQQQTSNRPPPGFGQRPPEPPQHNSGMPLNYDEILKSLTISQQNQAKDIADLKLQMGQIAEFIGQIREQGKLPSSTIPNPKGGFETAKAITLRSGRQIENDPIVPEQSRIKKAELQKDDPTTIETPELQGKKVSIPNSVSANFVPPFVPFPGRFAKSRKDEQDKEILETFRKVQVNIPLLDAIKQVPKYAKFLKELCTTKRRFRDGEVVKDFYLDLVEDNRRITPRDYLELALRPMQSSGKDTGAKCEIRESIRALFPDRECFTLVRPVNSENDLQRLDQISLDKMRPEFRSGLDALTKFVFERTRPKQVGATIMTGPVLAGLTQSFLDALNNGAVPTISSSWQSVEEAECRRAYDVASEVYMSSYDRSKPPEEAALREAHEEAVHKALAAFNASAVGSGPVRQKYEKLLQTFFRKAFEDYKKSSYMEADIRCSNNIHNMEKKLRTACHAPDAKIDHVLNVLDGLVSEYEASSHGPGKWQKLATFLQQSLEGPIHDLAKKQLDQIGSEKGALTLKCRSIEDKMGLLNKQLEASEKNKTEYLQRYENAISDKKALADDYMSRITNLQSKVSSLEERCSTILKDRDHAKQESLEWKRKFEQVSSKQKVVEEQVHAEIATLRSRSSATEAMLAAAREQAQSALEEAAEWKRKFDIAARETKAALEKAATVQERTNKQTHLREDALRAEFSATLEEKEDEIKDLVTKVEQSEQRLTTLSLELKAAESKVKNYDLEASSLKIKIKDLGEKLESAKETSQSFEREARILEHEKTHLEEKYLSEFKRFEEAQERCKIAEREAKRATDMADKARAEAVTAQKEKSEAQRVAMERLTQIERAEREVENLERMKADLREEIEKFRVSEMDAIAKVALLEARVEEREKEIELLLKSNNEQRSSTVQVLESLLESERAARAEATNRAEALSMQLQSTQGKLDALQQELTSVRLSETALDSKLKTASHGKRSRPENYDVGVESVQDMEIDDRVRGRKRSKSTNSPPKYSQAEDGGSVFRADEDNSSQQTESEDYMKFTVLKLKQLLTKHGFGAEVLQLRNPNKKDILSLYEKHVLQK